jgi:hypothetical protein
MMLPGRYVNINPVLVTFISEIDTNPQDLNYLTSLGQADSPEIQLAKQLLKKYWI